MPRYWDDEWYEPSRPRPVKDGIKAKNVRGAFGASWWAKRWIAALETFGWGNRLTRGRSYARQGQVLNIDLQLGRVNANVQVHKFICGGTLEEHIDELIESKRALAESVLGVDESWLTELNTMQLRDLVALRHADVVEE